MGTQEEAERHSAALLECGCNVLTCRWEWQWMRWLSHVLWRLVQGLLAAYRPERGMLLRLLYMSRDVPTLRLP